MADSFTFEEALEAPKSFTFEEAGGLSPELQARKSDLQSQMVSARIEGLQNKAAMTAADIGQRAAYTISLMNPGDLFRKLVNPQGTALVPPEQMKRILYPAGGEFSPGSIEGAIGDFITESASSMTQPDVAAALALGKASPELAGRYFQTQMIQQSPEAVARLAQSKTPAEAVKSGLETAASVGLPLAIEAGLRSPPGPQVPMDTGKVFPPRAGAAVPDPRLTELIQEGVKRSDALALIEGTKTTKQVVDENAKMISPAWNADVEQSRGGHGEAFAAGYDDALARVDYILKNGKIDENFVPPSASLKPLEVRPAEAPEPKAAPSPPDEPVVAKAGTGEAKRKYSGEAYRGGAQEFQQLVREHGLNFKWFTDPDLLNYEPTGSYADIHWDIQLRNAYRQALKDIGIEPKRITEKVKFEALPKLKAHIEAHAKMVPVALDELPEGTKFTRAGQEYTVKETNPDTETVTIKNKETLKVPMQGAVGVDPGSVKKPLELAGPESVEEQVARLTAEEQAVQKKAAQEQVAAAAAKRLVGSVGDIGQGDLLGGGDLFSATAKPSPVPAVAAEKAMQGMGGAVPAEFEGNESFVSNMFAAIDRDRVAMGKPPMAETRPRTWDEDNQRALAQMNRDPKWIPELLDRMEKSPRPLLSWENAGVVWQRALWKTEYNNALQRIASAFDDKREADLSAAKTDAAVFEDKLERLDRIVGRNGTGSEAGRTLQAQKMGAGDDFTLVEMTLQKRASVGGRRLTPEETARIQKDVERLNALNAALQKSLADADAARLKAETDRAMAELRLSKAPTFDQRILSAAESIVVKMERAAEPAAARLRERLMRMSAGVDPTIIYDAALVGSARIARLGLDLAKFTDSMVKDFSEKIRPMIPEIWKAANDMLDAVKAPEPVKRAIRKTDLASVKTDVTRAIQEKLADKELSKIRFEINKLAKAFWQSGIRDREAMVDALYDTVGEVTGMTRRQVAEAFAGYGDYRQLSKDRMSVDLRGMKGELQQIAKLEAMQRGEPPLKSGLERRTPTEAERQLIKLVNDAKNKFQVPVQDPNTQLKSALDTLKTTLANRIKDYEGRLAKKDFAPRPRREVQLDAEAVRLRAQAEYIKKRWRQELLADRMKNRTLWEKIMDWGTKYRRFTALSSPVVIPKLIAAAGWRAASTLAEDISGGGLSLVPGIRQISQRAPLEGYGGQLRATMRGYGAAFTKGLEDAARVARTGHSDIDVLYGKAGESYTGESEMASVLLSFPGRLHGVIKAPVKRGAFEKATQRLGEFYARQGLDVTSEPVKLRIALEAYKAGNRAIFLQDNRMASAFNSALAALERKGETGHAAPGGKAMATAARFMFPVTRVPVNIAAETLQYGAGSVTGSVRAVKAIRNGLDTLTPDQADLITRELKKGLLGMAALYLGYMGYQHIGGVYEQGKKPKSGEIKPGAVRMFDVDIPENLLHHPVMNTIQLGATVHKTALEKLRRKDPDTQGIPAGVLAAAWGLADEVPFIQGPHRLFGGLASPSTRQKTVGIELGSVTIPQAVAWTAQVLDQRRETPPANLYQRIMGPPAKLKPATIPQYLETRIPGLRQNVPLAPPKTAPLNFNQILQNQ